MEHAVNWFTVDTVDERTYCISEYRHWEETHCYLMIGGESALLIDTGLGVCDISEVVRKLTDKPVAAVATHVHWDHIGGHKYFPDFFAHRAELDWLGGAFPLPVQIVRNMLQERCELPDGFAVDAYEIFRGMPSRVLEDGDTIDLGGRIVRVLHTPGHAPGHMCFWEEETEYLFTGDLVYKGTLFAHYPSTDPQSYLTSLEKITKCPAKRIFPGHHSMDIDPKIVRQMRDALQDLNKDGLLHHGSGTHSFGDWAIML